MLMKFRLGLATPKSRVTKGSLQISWTPEADRKSCLHLHIGNTDKPTSDVNIAVELTYQHTHSHIEVQQDFSQRMIQDSANQPPPTEVSFSKTFHTEPG